MERSDAAASREQGNGRGPFEAFTEQVNHRVSRAPFFVVCLGIIALWAASYPLWHSSKDWQALIHTISSVLSLLLLVLLENAGRRSEEAAQEKLNVLAEGLVALMHSHSRDDEELRQAVADLRNAVGLEEKH